MKKYLFSLLLKQKVNKIKKISRINKKNFVYFCETKKSSFAIKIYRNKYNSKLRFNNEVFWLKKFQEKHFFETPKIYLLKKVLCWNILVLYWVDGISMKNVIKHNNNYCCIERLRECISTLEKVWNYESKFNIDIDDSFKLKCGKDIEKVIKNLKQKRKKLRYCYDELLYIYKLLQKNMITNNILINSDISLHEFLFRKNKVTLLDYEYFCYGDINNDLAGIFYSSSNSFINDENKKIIKDIYDLLSSNKAFNLNNFIVYLIERIVLADFFASETISDNEIINYNQMIVKLYSEGNI